MPNSNMRLSWLNGKVQLKGGNLFLSFAPVQETISHAEYRMVESDNHLKLNTSRTTELLLYMWMALEITVDPARMHAHT